MKKYYLYGLSLLLLHGSSVVAQDSISVHEDVPAAKVKKECPVRTVKGRVVSATTGKAITVAMIRVVGMDGYSTLSQLDGTFEMEVPLSASSLEISAPDMNTVRCGLMKEEMQHEVKLYPDLFTAEYGHDDNLLASDYAADFRFSNAVTIEEDIQRRLGANVRTVMRSGIPGVGGVMFMNGVNSLNVNAQPLIVVDDVIFDQQYNRSMLHDGFYNDILSNISPSDIEQVTVLRNGTALYGAKGANGVILIRTRRNHSMATRITASLSAGVTLEPKFYSMMNASQYKGYASDLLSTTNTTISSFKFLNNDPTYYYYPQYHNETDWKEQVYRTAVTQNYSINVEGGDDVANYNLSVGYVNNQSTLEYNSMNRINIRFNTDINLTDKFSTRFDVSFANQTRNLRNDGAPENYVEGTPTSPAFLAYAKSPMLSPYAYANGVLSDSYLDITDESYLDEALADYSGYNWRLANPLALNEYAEAANKNHFENSMVNITVTPKYKFNKHLSIQEHFSYNLVNTNEQFYIPINGVPDYYVASVGGIRTNETRSLFSRQNSIWSDTRINWGNRYGAHAVDLFGGARMDWESYSVKSQLGYETGNDKTPFMNAELKNAQTTGDNDNWNSVAWYIQANYDYMQRYYLQLNLTAEGSSRFGKDADGGAKILGASWGFFPGVQAAWVVSNESWFAKVKPVNYLRFTLGYDISGNDDVDCYAARSYFRANQFMQSVSSLSFENIGNNHLAWETTKRFNFGIETNMVDNRLNLRFNYFKSKTDNLLGYQALGFLSGLEKNWSNAGSLKNSGFDVTAMVKVLTLKDFQWELGASMGHYNNEITGLADGAQYMDTEVYGATVRTAVGHAANMFYGYKVQGVFSTSEEAQAAGLYVLDANGVDRHYFGAGDVHFVDLDGDHCITEADRVFIGNPNPDIYGNIFTSLMWKRFRLDVNFNYSLGNDVYNYMRSQLEGGNRFMNQTLAVCRRWQTEGQQTDIPKATFQDPMGNSRFSDRWIEDGSYLRLKTVTLSYTLPLNSPFLQGLQFWIQGNNLVTFTNYLGADPEFATTSKVLGQGVDTGLLPMSRSVVAGIKINL